MAERISRVLGRTLEPQRGLRGFIITLIVGVVAYGAVLTTVMFGTAYDSQVLVNALINVMLVISLFLIFGMSGQISIGHAAFFGLGAYTAGYFATSLGIGFPWTLLAGLLAGGLAGCLLIPLSRLEVHYFVMTTLGLGLVLYHLFGTTASLTGGWTGMGGIPGFGDVFGFHLSGTMATATIVYVLLFGQYMATRTLVLNRPGRIFRSIRDDALAASSLGIKVTAAKAEASVIGCGFAGLAGALSAHVNGFLSPESYGLMPSTLLVLAVVLGGTGSLLGAVIAGLGMPYVNEWLSGWADISPVIFGALIVLIMAFAPTGLAGLISTGLQRVTGGAREPENGHLVAGHGSSVDHTTRLRDLLRLDGDHSPPTVTAKGVSKRFGGVIAVQEVDIELLPHEIHGIIGPNGAGKSSLYNILTGVTPADSGSVYIGQDDVTKMDVQSHAARGLIRTFQNGRLFDTMTVFENVLAAVGPNPALSSLEMLLRPRLSFSHEARAKEIARHVVSFMDLDALAHLTVTSLAYGQRRLVEIARALAANPRVLLLDEPAAGLSPTDRQTLVNVLIRMRDDFGITIAIVEHDLDVIGAVCDRVTVLHEGRNIATETPKLVLADPDVRAAYMGRSASSTPEDSNDQGRLTHVESS